ncbi:MAG: methyltransferase domain-containing protein [Actinobacteria bacterium]|nr:methyltransferase domain-containing protein [Actinomycetota bacterium]
MAPLDHWVRHVMNEKVAEIITMAGPAELDVLEVSGTDWADFGFKSYRTVEFPGFDICRDRLPETFDLIIAEQVFEHLSSPRAAAQNIRRMLRPGGMFVITTPFLIKFHPCPHDYSRWTKEGMVLFLEENGFVNVHTDSWGNRECLVANLEEWVDYDPEVHSLENQLDVPLQVWGFGHRPGRLEESKAAAKRAAKRAKQDAEVFAARLRR